MKQNFYLLNQPLGCTMRKSELETILKKLVSVLSEFHEEYETESSDNTDKAKSKRRLKTHQNESIHKLKQNAVCSTDDRGFATPENKSPTEIVLDASEGFIPLWKYGTTLRWCFDETALNSISNSAEVKEDVRSLLIQAIMAWGDAAPVKFKEERESYDFKIIVHDSDNCSPFGCTLARAFFPDSGRHNLEIYPKMFEQSEKEQVDTLTHELGHIFGLRHFFAQVRESAWPSVIFGKHRAFSIMNYGDLSELTDDDKNDLKNLYMAVWTGELAEINGTPIRLFAPYHEAGELVLPSALRIER